MKTLRIFIFILTFSGFTGIYAQLENKGTISIFTGVPLIKKAGEIQSENIFYGYSPIPYLGVGLNYNKNHKLSFGANLRQWVSQKTNFSIANTNLGVGAKYNFLPMDKKVSPYITGELDLVFIYLKQKANVVREQVTPTDPLIEVQHDYREVNNQEARDPFYATGAMVGLGSDFTLKLKYTLFVSANYFISNAHTSLNKISYYSENKSKLGYPSFQVGLRFSFGKNKSIY